jgi:hypothetical protein
MGEKKETQVVTSAPNVVEAYRDYVPPQCVLPMVHELLKSVPPRYLIGLQTIVLTNQSAQPRKRKQQKIWSRNRKIKIISARGYYSGASQSTQASITLHIDNIFKGASLRDLRIPIVRYYPLASVLYHEIGHHIHAEHIPVHEGKENVAEKWSTYLTGQFLRKHYWYARPILYVMWLLIRFIKPAHKKGA